MRVGELRFGSATICALTVLPALPTAVDGVVGRSSDGDVGSSDADERAFLLLVPKGGFTVEDGLLGLVSQLI